MLEADCGIAKFIMGCLGKGSKAGKGELKDQVWQTRGDYKRRQSQVSRHQVVLVLFCLSLVSNHCSLSYLVLNPYSQLFLIWVHSSYYHKSTLLSSKNPEGAKTPRPGQRLDKRPKLWVRDWKDSGMWVCTQVSEWERVMCLWASIYTRQCTQQEHQGPGRYQRRLPSGFGLSSNPQEKDLFMLLVLLWMLAKLCVCGWPWSLHAPTCAFLEFALECHCWLISKTGKISCLTRQLLSCLQTNIYHQKQKSETKKRHRKWAADKRLSKHLFINLECFTIWTYLPYPELQALPVLQLLVQTPNSWEQQTDVIVFIPAHLVCLTYTPFPKSWNSQTKFPSSDSHKAPLSKAEFSFPEQPWEPKEWHKEIQRVVKRVNLKPQEVITADVAFIQDDCEKQKCTILKMREKEGYVLSAWGIGQPLLCNTHKTMCS